MSVAAAPSLKIKTLPKGNIKKASTQINTEPTSVLKRRKPETTKAKAEDRVTGLKSKRLNKDEGTKKRVKLPNPSTTEDTRHETVVDRPKNAKRAERPTQKQRGPWKSHSPSPSPSLPSEPEPSHSESEEGEAEEESGPEAEDVHLYGFSTDEDSSGDDDLDVVDEGADVDVGSLPTISRDDATVKRKLEKAKRKPAAETGVVFLGRIPHGFYEDQLRAYFSQFGDISRLRVSRNKKTGRSKHYGFIEFASGPVAQIVAETMDDYLLLGHILTCKVIPKDEVHPELWVGANRKWRVVPTYRLAHAQHNKPRSEGQQRAAEKRLLSRQASRKRKLAEAGIMYDFDKVEYKRSKSVS
jgi:nucleolar protein 15